jgi:c-di-GMP-related signal transduction protein
MTVLAHDSSVLERDNPEARPSPPTRYLGRQPIVDEKSRLCGYELLFRDGAVNSFSGDPEEATRQVVDYWLMLMPEPDQTLAFVNCTRATLLEGVVTILPPPSTVLEIPENIEADAALLGACRALKKQGYRLALDGFSPLRLRAPLLELADYVKIDYRASDARARREIDAVLAGNWALRIAEKIESEAEMREAQQEGCMLFQGYFFSRPELLSSPRLPQNRLVYLRLLAALQQVPSDLDEVDSLVSSDATLCYRVLRLANSAMQGRLSSVSSVREALLVVGDDSVRRMVTVALAGVLSGHRPPALVSMALARARFCELLAPALSKQPQHLYLLGMLSLLDALLETPMQRILKTLPVHCEMKAALMGQPGTLGSALELVRSLEACDWERCEMLREPTELTESAIAAMYVESLRWAANALQP